jgi:uncharacterized protein (DUF302 family)
MRQIAGNKRNVEMEHPLLFAFRARTALDFAAAEARARELLAQEGFGVLSEIAVDQVLKAKLGVEGAPCKILGACNPPFAHRALELEPLVSVLLPCNVVLWERGDHREVAAMNPSFMGALLPALEELGREAGARLTRVLERLEAEAPA